MKKPDAVTCLTPENFREKIFHLPVTDLCGVGHATAKVLAGYGIRTVGQLAVAHPPMLQHRLGVNGLRLIEMANGRDERPVLPADAELPMKSVSHGITTYRDMMTPEETWPVILSLCEEVGHKLLAYGKTARGVSLQVRDNALQTRQYQARLSLPTDSYSVIAKEVYRLLREKHRWERPLRSVSAGAIDLCREGTPCQIGLFDDAAAVPMPETVNLDGYRLLRSSDAHYLENILEPTFTLEVREKSAQGIFDAIAGR
jgi:DNA polymerase-4